MKWPPDDAADVLGDLSEEQSAEVLDLLAGEEAGQVRELLAHPEDTAGGLMTSRFIAVTEDMSAAQAIGRCGLGPKTKTRCSIST